MRVILLCGLMMVLVACGSRKEPPSPVTLALAGKTLSNETGARFTLTPSGSITGPGITGAWWGVGPKTFCRTLVEPEAMAGTQCQQVSVHPTRVVFHSATGRTLSFRIENP